MIETKTQEIKIAEDETFSDLVELAESLPDSSPRFVILSYPLTMVCSSNLLIKSHTYPRLALSRWFREWRNYSIITSNRLPQQPDLARSAGRHQAFSSDPTLRNIGARFDQGQTYGPLSRS